MFKDAELRDHARCISFDDGIWYQGNGFRCPEPAIFHETLNS